MAPSIYTSLDGEEDDDDDDDDGNHDSATRRRSKLWKTLSWFAFGSLLAVPMTEFVFDPLLLTWAMPFFG